MNLPTKVQSQENFKKIKRWTILLIILLVFVIGFQGFFINHLSGEVNALIKDSQQVEPGLKSTPTPNTPAIPWRNNFWQGFPHDPFAHMEEMQKRMDRLFDNSGLHRGFGNFPQTTDGFGFSSISGFSIQDDGDQYVVTGKIQGAKESSINVTIDDRQLHITAETQKSNTTKDDQKGHGMFSSRSMFSSRMEKQMTLPGDVEPSGMKLDFDDDLLTIKIPKKVAGLLY